MQTPHRLNSRTACEMCKSKRADFLCQLTLTAQERFESIKVSTSYPEGSLLFLENEAPRGIFLICSGQVKLSVSSKGGKTLLLQIAKPGEIVGLSASMSGTPYEVTAECLYPSEVAFIAREDFLGFVSRFPEAFGAVTRQLSLQYDRACNQLRTIGLCDTAHQKLARLFLHWPADEKNTGDQDQIKIPLTHEQIAACMGSTRETVTRTLSEFKAKHLVTLKGATIVISNRPALMAVSGE
jgi:CRP/FNR family transcriptional regulator, cyclic AMP receptor protein